VPFPYRSYFAIELTGVPPPLQKDCAKQMDESRNNRNPPGEEDSFSSQAAPLFLLTGIFLLNFISRIIPAPLLPTIEADLKVSHGQAGTLFLFISAGYFLTLLASGFVSSRLTHRQTIILSAVAVGLALLGTAFSSGLSGMRIGMLLLGMGAGVYLPSGMSTLMALVHPKHLGKALAIHELAPNLSFVAAPLLSVFFLPFLSWRGALAVLGGVSILIGLSYARFGRGGEFHGRPPTPAACRVLLSQPAFWIMMVLFSLGISGSMGVYTMLPLYLVSERGMDQNWANTLVILSRIPGPGVAFLAGWATDRLGAKKTLSGVLFFTGFMTLLLGVLDGSWIVPPIFLQATLSVCYFPAGFAALSFVGPPETRNVAVSLAFPFALLVGGGAVPTLIGFMGDAGKFGLGISLVGVLILAGALLPRGLRLSPNP
jgi:MFS transporter, NNP family, nitrate/nitrite transporter